MNARKGNITVEPYTRSVRTVQREGRKSLNFPSTLFLAADRDSLCFTTENSGFPGNAAF